MARYILIIFLSALPFCGSAQSGDWRIEQGKAVAQKTISLPGKTSDEIYKNVNRWLIKHFKDPEDHLKARIEGEYLRGTAQHPNFLQSGSLSAAYLQYSFIFYINNEEVIFKLTDVLVVYPSSDEADRAHHVEEYINANSKKSQKSTDTALVLSSLAEFSKFLFESFEKTMPEHHNKF